MVQVEVSAQIDKPFAVCQPCNQFGLFTRKVTSGMCISTTRDPATKSKYPEQFISVSWSSVFKSRVVN